MICQNKKTMELLLDQEKGTILQTSRINDQFLGLINIH